MHYKPIAEEENEPCLRPDSIPSNVRRAPSPSSSLFLDDSMTETEIVEGRSLPTREGILDVWETAKLSLEFCILWVCSTKHFLINT